MKIIRFALAWLLFIIGAFFLGTGQRLSRDAYDQFVELVLGDLMTK